MVNTLVLEKKKILSNRTVSILIKGKLFDDISIFEKYFDGEQIKQACKEGCPNYKRKWSCPPFSKTFLNIKKKYSSACLLCFSTKMESYSDIKNKYLAVKAANVTLKSLIEKCARNIEMYTKGYSLLTGSCRLCKPCQYKINLPCRYPNKMRYSMEATGLNVQKLCLDFLNHHLLWYENKKLPKYTSVVVLILYNQPLKSSELSNIISKIFAD